MGEAGSDTTRPINQSAATDYPYRSEWRCLSCDYPLAQITGDRCPECGGAFSASDFDAIRAVFVPQRVFDWEQHRSWGNWLAMAWLVLTRPRLFLQKLPVYPDVVSASEFATRGDMLATVTLFLAALHHSIDPIREYGGGEMWCSLVTPILLWAPLSMFCRAITVGACATMFRVAGRVAGERVWQAVLSYQSVHLTMAVICIAVAIELRVIERAIRLDNTYLESLALGALKVTRFSIIACGALIAVVWIGRIVTSANAISRPHLLRVFAWSSLLLVAVAVLAGQSACLSPAIVIAL